MTGALDWVGKWARYSPSVRAFTEAESGEYYTYSELHFLSCRVAGELRERWKISRGDRVAVLSTNELEYLPLFFAVQRLGAIMVPVNFRLTSREIEHILKDSDAKLLVAQDELRQSTCPCEAWSFDGEKSLRRFIQNELKLKRSLRLSVEQSAQASSFPIHTHRTPSWEIPFAAEETDPCLILYTSGTTGAPKGAIVTPRMLFWNSVNTGLRLNLTQNDVALSFLPFFHTGGWNVLLTPFVHRGAHTVLMRKFNADAALELSEKYNATILFGVPTTMEMMARSPAFDRVKLEKMRYAIVGGEPMPIELIRTWQKKNIPIRQGYGLTEFGPNVFSLNEDDAIRKIGSIGFANFYIDVRVVDSSGKDISTPGEIGELLLRGPSCSPGYWRNPEATAQLIENGWLHTGDLVRFDDERYFYVAGRKKDMFISGGENVYPVEVEQLLGTHPDIREVAVIGIKDEKWGEVGKAFVVLHAERQLTEAEVLLFCRDKLAKFKTPRTVEFLTELPKGDSGKILKREKI